ncbi:MAG: hypothetical protein H0W83_10185 [Planctomycetes bacterium]|nr:hypothetical protein [Planctomycetota bacterium]
MTAAVLAVLGSSLGGCLDKPTLAKPGASGHIVFHLWGQPGMPPTVFRTDDLTQEGSRFDHLVMRPVEIRRPFEEGIVFIHSPKGQYSSPKAEAGSTAAENTIQLDGPVRIAGSWRGEPVVGLAQSAVMRRSQLRSDRRLDMTDVVLLTRGSLGTYRTLSFDEEGHMGFTTYHQEPKQSPALSAALAALPHPLVFPEFREADRQRGGIEIPGSDSAP